MVEIESQEDDSVTRAGTGAPTRVFEAVWRSDSRSCAESNDGYAWKMDRLLHAGTVSSNSVFDDANYAVVIIDRRYYRAAKILGSFDVARKRRIYCISPIS
jgi:hypothetical protein